MRRRGTLILVVGPSGVGKDTILNGAQARLAGDPCFVFVQREITRPADAGDEIHTEVSPAEFQHRAEAGEYALSWEVHGLCYGVPAGITKDLARGRTVLVNVSRGVIEEARRRFAPVLVVQVTASAEMLRRRLAARGRETPAEIEERVARAGRYRVEGKDVVTVDNDGPIEQAVGAFLGVLSRT